jgi:hypothetical protein
MECFRRAFPFLGPLRESLARPLKAAGKCVFGDTNRDTIRSGNWYGNDTTWRMVLDLNRILMYADSNGDIGGSPARRMLCIVDGIIGGEGNGPMDPTPKQSGVVVVGANPVAVDLVCACLMGFDYRRLPVLSRAVGSRHALPLTGFGWDEVICMSSAQPGGRHLSQLTGMTTPFRPHFGWHGHVEMRL